MILTFLLINQPFSSLYGSLLKGLGREVREEDPAPHYVFFIADFR